MGSSGWSNRIKEGTETKKSDVGLPGTSTSIVIANLGAVTLSFRIGSSPPHGDTFRWPSQRGLIKFGVFRCVEDGSWRKSPRATRRCLGESSLGSDCLELKACLGLLCFRTTCPRFPASFAITTPNVWRRAQPVRLLLTWLGKLYSQSLGIGMSFTERNTVCNTLVFFEKKIRN
jgi:hypothetical protein